MFRNHFPPPNFGQKSTTDKSPPAVRNLIKQPPTPPRRGKVRGGRGRSVKDQNTEIKLCRKGIWQFNYPDFIFDESDYWKCISDAGKFQTTTFESMDAAFDILENECSFLPIEIRLTLKEYLEPMYIRVDFYDRKGSGRGPTASFWIWEENKWKLFAKIYENWFCDEDEAEYLKEYRFIWGLMQEDETINSYANFQREMHTNTGRMIQTKFAPEFDSRDEYYAFCEQRETEEKALRIAESQSKENNNDGFDGSPPKKKKRRFERAHPTGDLFEVGD